ncbi:hypothetical protein AMECASPLE_039474 [Ameca splendens]|uniref:Uncharacterized protein n=1 Tax=Ameca splendens TaxID=208324 RepID=A0ABV1AI86_9TELE
MEKCFNSLHKNGKILAKLQAYQEILSKAIIHQRSNQVASGIGGRDSLLWLTVELLGRIPSDVLYAVCFKPSGDAANMWTKGLSSELFSLHPKHCVVEHCISP